MQDKLAQEIMQILQRHARVQSFCDKEHTCFALQKNKIINLIQREKEIMFILPAFPAKSPNTEKTYGILPDLGEEISLCFLNDICAKIQKIYANGARMMICSDGRVFNDLVLVPDDHVDAYAEKIRNIIYKNKLTHLSTYSLDDCYQGLDYFTMRTQLLELYSEDLSSIKYSIKTDLSQKKLFNGIHRFIFEDRIIHHAILSKNKIRTLSKEVSYQIIQRSNAWGNLLKEKFPDAIRLSIHPQHCGSEKFGIAMMKSDSIWSTPWHRVVLEENNQYRLIRRKDAEIMNATPIFENHQFSHYVIEE